MTKLIRSIIMIMVIIFIAFTGCNQKLDNNLLSRKKSELNEKNNENTLKPDRTHQKKKTSTPVPSPTPDLYEIKPDEAGKIMIVMFHNFVDAFTPTKYDKGRFTITFRNFEKLLERLYEKNYRLIGLNDFLNNSIDVPAGCIPIVFTFDDGTKGQFSLIEENGRFKVNPKSAAGILEKFSNDHPDFGLEGTFYINLGTDIFKGKGTIKDRLKYLLDKGFEIGNHTFTHINLAEAEKSMILEEIGANQKRIVELIPGYTMDSLALPLGNYPKKELRKLLVNGEYKDIQYSHKVIMKVGSNPTVPTVNKNFDFLFVPRVRAPGMNPVKFDLNWWIDNLPISEQYVSDGNPGTICIPAQKENMIDNKRIEKMKSITIQ